MRTLTKSQLDKISLKSKIEEVFEDFENAEIISLNDSEIIFEDLNTGDTYISSYTNEEKEP